MTEQTTDPNNSIREKVAEHSAELVRLVELLDLAFARGAKTSKAYEDRVVFPLLVSCRDIVEEILFAVNEGFGRAALRGARTMYECVVIARYLNLHPDKTDSFLSMFHVQWAKILQNIPVQYRSPELDVSLTERVPKYAQGKMVGLKDLNWSGEHTLAMAKEAGQLADIHSLAFDYASAYIHPSAIFFLTMLSQSSPDGEVFQVGTRSQEPEAMQALRIAHDLILNAVELRLKYSPSVAQQERFETCKEDFIRIWGYPPHI